jgi:shikimate dehydrogenase
MTYEQLTEEDMARHLLIINTTPLGMYPLIGECPPIPYEHITPNHYLFDLVYNPATTLFLKRGEERGANTMGGIMMLQTQAIASWHIWQRELTIPQFSDAN